MDTTIIQNSFLKVKINHKGAELASIEKDGTNYLWEIDPTFWDKTSPVLFPIVGGFKNNVYESNSKNYSLSRHGFARDQVFDLISVTDDSATFSLTFSEETLNSYPFKFTLNIKYHLVTNKLFTTYTVSNASPEKMYYSLGAHPAFAIVGNIEDYSLEFDKAENLTTHKLEGNLFSGEIKEVKLNGNCLPLNYDLFSEDAIVLKDSVTSAVILKKNKERIFKMSFPEFPYLGIWTKRNAPFICIEPWLGIADSMHASGKLEEKEGIQVLEGDASSSFEWNVEFY